MQIVSLYANALLHVAIFTATRSKLDMQLVHHMLLNYTRQNSMLWDQSVEHNGKHTYTVLESMLLESHNAWC